MANLTGGEGNDTITGTNAADTINSRGGNDTVLGQSGNDSINGGLGVDTLSGGDGDDTLLGDQGIFTGDAGNDSITTTGAGTNLSGGVGDDWLAASGLGASISGGTGDDRLSSGGTHASLIGEDGNDSIYGGSFDTIIGGDGDDFAVDNGFSANIDLGGGNDSLSVTSGDLLAEVNGGAGFDHLTFDTYHIISIIDWGNPPSNESFENIELNIGNIEDLQIYGLAPEEAILEFNILDSYFGEYQNVTIATNSRIDAHFVTNHQLAITSYYSQWLNLVDQGIWSYGASVVGGQLSDRIEATDDGARYYSAAAFLSGESGDDTLIADANQSYLYGGDGNDSIIAEAGNDFLYGDVGQDHIDAGVGNDLVFGGAGDDTLLLGTDDDTAAGGTGDDTIDGGDGTDIAIFTGNFADYIVSQISYNTFTVQDTVGTDGTDTVTDINILRFADGDQPVIILGMEIVGDDTAEDLSGGGFADLIDGAGGNDSLAGQAGSDQIFGGTGDDSVSGQTGNDSIDGGSGNDTLYAADGDDVVSGGDGADVLIGGDGKGDDAYDGGDGTDLVIYASSRKNPITVNLTKGTATGVEIGNDRLTGIENVLGGSKNDSIIGDAQDNLLDGGLGVDTLTGGLGDDTLFSNGSDTLIERDNQGHDLVISNASHSLGSNFEDLTLVGSAAINGTGNGLDNRIAGNKAANILNGGNGADVLFGGGGADTFAFVKASESTRAAHDTILDFFRSRGDSIDLSAIDANGGAAGDGAFGVIGAQDFHGIRGELRWTVTADGALVQGDTNGDGVADLEFLVIAVGAIKITDFIL